MLNSQPIGNLFSIENTEARYVPATRLTEGLNTFTAQSKDIFGHLSDKIESHFTIDTIPPAFLALSPATGSTLTVPQVTIQGTLNDPTASVMLLDASGNVLSVTNGSTFAFALTLKAGFNTFTLIARDSAGNSSSTALALNYSDLSVVATSITSGASVSTDYLFLNGTINGPDNTGITVNGLAAVVANGKFYVNNLPLQPGSNTLTITATTPDGQTLTQTLIVVSAGSSPFQVTVSPESGVAPLDVAFTVSDQTPNGIRQIAVDFDGNGTTDSTITDPTMPMAFTYNTPGVYQAKVTITDNQGATFSQTLAVVVFDAAQMDKLFTRLWSEMNAALTAGNVVAASKYLNASAKLKYRPVLDVLLPNMPEIVASYSSLKRVSVSENIGEYAINRSYQGQNRLYLIYFLKDADGVWRLDAM